MSTIHSLAEENNIAAQELVKRYEVSNINSAKYLAIAALVSAILLGASLIAGKYLYIETITNMKMSMGCLGGMAFGGTLAVFCVWSVHDYLSAKKAKKQFSKPINQIDSQFKQRLINDLTKSKAEDKKAILTEIQKEQEELTDEKRTKAIPALQVISLIFAGLLAAGAFALWVYALDKSNALGSHGFTRFDALSMLGSTSLPLAVGAGALAYTALQHKKSDDFEPSLL